ncbi:thioesterase II family protein [Kordia aestuariivivens]|uniref:thioesterase II family protein n=1 Tax=Kordia aestuariivivens TaxID=2759037 RepID=UPI001C072638|nr:thioesterase domain-containing protein [Kordia aestuariivivens]
MQLFLLPFAGGNRFSYDFLIKKLKTNTSNIKCYPLELPGRGRRFGEKLARDKKLAIDDYLHQLTKLRDKTPYIIYGHSMGATLGLSIIKRMEEKNDAPLQFIATGNAGPKIKEENEDKPSTKKHLLNDEKFKKALRKLGGIPDEILENEELYSFFSSILRADFQILEEGGNADQSIIINTPIYALMGDQEKSVKHINNWQKFTNTSFKAQVLTGNHFFIHEHTETLTTIILSTYKKA